MQLGQQLGSRLEILYPIFIVLISCPFTMCNCCVLLYVVLLSFLDFAFEKTIALVLLVASSYNNY